MNVPPLTQSFVLHFGEMGSRWGINRTVGQIYALLFVSEPAAATRTRSSRNSASRAPTSAWASRNCRAGTAGALCATCPATGASTSPHRRTSGTIFQTLAEERQKREIEPTL
jgi:hypothetical protein